MSWADPVIATALAVLAERAATTAQIFVAAPSGWNSQDVWLTRVKRRSPRSPARTQRHSLSTDGESH